MLDPEFRKPIIPPQPDGLVTWWVTTKQGGILTAVRLPADATPAQVRGKALRQWQNVITSPVMLEGLRKELLSADVER